MQHLLFSSPQESYQVAFLIKSSGLRKASLQQNYITPLIDGGAVAENCIAFSLAYDNTNKAPAKLVKQYLTEELLPELKDLKVKYAYVADSTYFKALTGQKPDSNFGNVLPCKVAGFEHLLIVPGVNYQSLAFNPNLIGKLRSGILAIISHATGNYKAVGSGLLKNVKYVYRDDLVKAKEMLDSLLDKPELAADIEGFSLSMFDSGIATIGFAYSAHDAVQFQVDWRDHPEKTEDGHYGYYEPNDGMRALLKDFFKKYKGRIAWHRANHDVKIIIYLLWMEHDLDRMGMLDGLDVMCPNMDDTKIIAYLALNSTAKVSYGLKDLAQEHAGNWAEDVKDIRIHPLDTLMKYNAVDAVCTYWLKQKLYPVMERDNQGDLYRGLFLESLRLIIHTELVGMPMCPKAIDDLEIELIGYRDEYAKSIAQHPLVLQLNTQLQTEAMEKKNMTLKTIQHPLSKYSHICFNPGSPQQMAKLLYDLMGLPIIAVTEKKQPATGGKIIKRLMDHVKAAPFKDLLQALVDYSSVEKVLTSFIPAFKNGRLKADGMHYLHGSFNLGGTISGRLSSSDPNMQNLPASSKYGKAIKKAFMAARGYLLGGADFAALEDRINALLTRDPNKLKVYTDGYDGHSLRAYYYWPHLFPDIENTVESINSIQTKYEFHRGKSKNPTFLLTYGGTAAGLVKTIGFSPEEAAKIEANYNSLYAVSQQWVKAQMEQASKQGYVELAFGLRLRTPLLGNTILNIKATPREAAAEARSAGNAVSGQSWGLLNNRAAVEFMKKVNASKWRGKVHVVALIHDAIYPIMPDDPECVAWVNNALCKEMSWQDDPLIDHPQVKIGANLDIFWPNWANAVTLDYPIKPSRVIEQCQEHAHKLKEKANAG